MAESIPGTRRPFLAEFEMYVLLAIRRLGGDAYGAAIARDIEETAERRVSIGALYATLSRLSDKGYVVYRVSDPLPVKGGRARKHYRLTTAGKDAIEHSAEMLRRMMGGASGGDGTVVPTDGTDRIEASA